MNNFLTFGQSEWWGKLFEDPQVLLSAIDDWYLDNLRPLMLEMPDSQTAENVESPLQLTMERERTAKLVYTGKRKPPQTTVKNTYKTKETHPRWGRIHVGGRARWWTVLEIRLWRWSCSPAHLAVLGLLYKHPEGSVTVKPFPKVLLRRTWFSTLQQQRNCRLRWKPF